MGIPGLLLEKRGGCSVGQKREEWTLWGTTKDTARAAEPASPHARGKSQTHSTSLTYNPIPASNPVILRTNPAVIPTECHYPKKDNVSSKAIKPTWIPFSSTLSAEERLGFSLRLMNGDWWMGDQMTPPQPSYCPGRTHCSSWWMCSGLQEMPGT
ncbi:zona pellucida sperm-binding protein 3-like [Gopherus flavomarginatus]|uniref:zona pellucida sperm-binding protein 3-like n=1 Tax=Gopherus flavomarginatus TaxID=286002 RepID=UPI0021CBFF3C|nr:zona pellucida sperm-binding protein 3-like [Gopherus flavomarginatus]